MNKEKLEMFIRKDMPPPLPRKLKTLKRTLIKNVLSNG
jgi:hypothetical protein